MPEHQKRSESLKENQQPDRNPAPKGGGIPVMRLLLAAGISIGAFIALVVASFVFKIF